MPAIPLVVHDVVGCALPVTTACEMLFKLTFCLGIAALLLSAGEPKYPIPNELALLPYL